MRGIAGMWLSQSYSPAFAGDRGHRANLIQISTFIAAVGHLCLV
jgi:hypothetical protein